MWTERSLKIKKKHCLLQKLTGDIAKKTKRLTEIAVLTKRFTERTFKKEMKVTQLFKSINY